MISSKEIEKIAKLMKIDIDDLEEHVPKIQRMLGYFDHLDSADLSVDLQTPSTVPIDSLRQDVAEPQNRLDTSTLKFGDGEHMRSPKLR